MSNATASLILKPYGKGGRQVTLPVDDDSKIYAGTMVAQLAATGMLCPGSTASSSACIGVATHDQDATAAAAVDGTVRASILTDQIFVFANSVGDPIAESTMFGSVIYMEDDHTVSKTNGGAQFAAGYFVGMEPDGTVRVYVTPYRMDPIDLTTLATSAGAGDVGILDAGNFTANTTVETALAELFQSVKSGKALIPIPLASCTLVAGTPMAAFADSASSAPGLTVVDSKAFGIRWNDAGTQVAVWTSFFLPQDLDTTAPMVLHVFASKTGATSGDAVTFLVTMFAQTAAALDDAASDIGGTTTAMTGAATAKTVANLTLSIATPPTPPAVCSMSIKPTNGTLGTDDVTVVGLWVEYKRKAITS